MTRYNYGGALSPWRSAIKKTRTIEDNQQTKDRQKCRIINIMNTYNNNQKKDNQNNQIFNKLSRRAKYIFVINYP